MRTSILSAALTLFTLSGCNSVNGTVEVFAPFTYVNRASDTMIEFCRRHPTDTFCRGVDTDNPSVTFQPGTYSGKLSFASNREAALEIGFPSGRSSSTTLRLTLPQGQSFPRYEGEVAIPASQLGQDYDVIGNAHTVESDTDPTNGTESCTYYRDEQICDWETVVPPNGGRPQQVYRCRWESVPHTGTRDVTYHYHSADTDFDVSLLRPGTRARLARFAGRSTSTRTVYDYQGPCYP